MRNRYDLAHLSWTLIGWVPYQWRLDRSTELGTSIAPDMPLIPIAVPGSVQEALRQHDLLPDWNIGLQSRGCEWVENRHWSYETVLPEGWVDAGMSVCLNCLGLDASGWVLLNGQEIGHFENAFMPHTFDLTPHLLAGPNRLSIVFACPPRALGQVAYTSQIQDWKPRFSYGWDWTARLVQTGIWDEITLEVSDGQEITELHCTTDVDAATHLGRVNIQGQVHAHAQQTVRLHLRELGSLPGEVLCTQEISSAQLVQGFVWNDLPVKRWWPNGQGNQPLYLLDCSLVDGMHVLDYTTRRIGFRTVEWISCEDAPPEADPWICVLNDRPLFLQGVNWTPIRLTFADVTVAHYRQILEAYQEMGCNLVRVWGGAFLEKDCFYDLCDELGLLVWQEFPLSSSGIDNWPPEGEQIINQIAQIARSYIERRQHHVSLIIWCGGNELQGALDGGKIGIGKPVTRAHPLIARLQQVVEHHDPTRRFLPTSASGPRFNAESQEMGQGLHWDVHGPWRLEGSLEDWNSYWQQDDALFRSEVGAPGASPVEIIRAFKGDLQEMPASIENPLWRRFSWWLEWPEFVAASGRDPEDLEEFVQWSQQRQAQALAIAAQACKMRFPRCGGFLLWMGHDSFPCTANTSVLDFYGHPKPAVESLKAIFWSHLPPTASLFTSQEPSEEQIA